MPCCNPATKARNSKIVPKTLIAQVVAALFPIVMVSKAPNVSESFRNVGAKQTIKTLIGGNHFAG
jgi:hypothetical protein